MDDKTARKGQSREGDSWALTFGFLVVLAALCVFGLLSWRAGIGAGVLSAVFGYVYGARARGEPIDVAEPSPQRTGNTEFAAQRAIVSALSQPALIIKGQHIPAFNAAAMTLFNFAEGASLPVANLRHPVILAGLAEVQAGGETFQCEIVPARYPDQYWLVHLTALERGSSERDVLMVLTDLAPVRQAERARADFLANASHELRTPLTSISGFVETMQGVAKDDKDAWPRFIDIIAEQARHMRGLITDLLSLSRIELGAHEVPETVIDLHQMLSESVEAMDHTAKANGLEIILDVPAGRMSMIGAESEVKQVVQNLVGNAMKYSPEGGVITVQAGRISSGEAQRLARSWQGANRITLLSSPTRYEETDMIWFRVRDVGEGIAPEYLPRLGERFFRVDASRGGPIEGTGLGLAIVKHIMAHHRGGLAVESIVGEGALFTVWFKAS